MVHTHTQYADFDRDWNSVIIAPQVPLMADADADALGGSPTTTTPGIMNLESHPWTMPEMIPWIDLVQCECSVPVLLSARRSTSICCPSSIWQHASMPRTGNAVGAASALPLLTAGPVRPLLLLGWICMDQIQPPRFRCSTPWLGRAATSPTPSASPKPAWSRLVRSGLCLVCPARIVFEASSQHVTH